LLSLRIKSSLKKGGKMLKVLQSKPVVFLQGFLFSGLITLGYIITKNSSIQFYIFGILLTIIFIAVYWFLFHGQAIEKLAFNEIWLILGATAGLCLSWGSFLAYVIIK